MIPIAKSVAIVVIAISTFSVAMFAAEPQVALPRELQEAAIGGYAISADASSVDVQLSDKEGRAYGSVSYAWERDGGVMIEWRPIGGESFDLAFNPVSGEFTLIADGVRYTKTIDLMTKQWRTDATTEAALRARGTELAVVGRLMSETSRLIKFPYLGDAAGLSANRGRPGTNCMVDCEPPPPGPGTTDPLNDDQGAGACDPILNPYCQGWRTVCGGEWVEGTKYSPFALTKPEICTLAQADAHEKCSNGTCYGCCEFMACAAACGWTDWFCWVGSVNGRRCSRIRDY